MKRFVKIICFVFAILMVAATPLSAAKPYQTYTYSIDGTALYSPDAYTPILTVDSKYMGLATAIEDPRDLEVDEDLNVYIADSKTNRIVCLDRYYKVRSDVSSDGVNTGYISKFVNAYGVDDSLSSPHGVFITKDKIVNGEMVEGRIYVCDTGKNRIVIFNKDGSFYKTLDKPESNLFEEGSIYKPVAIAVDDYDRLFVVSESTIEGIIVLTSEGEFTKFIGAQKVVASVWHRATPAASAVRRPLRPTADSTPPFWSEPRHTASTSWWRTSTRCACRECTGSTTPPTFWA